jgi:hypothetical protein
VLGFRAVIEARMADHQRRLRLPGNLTFTTLTIALALVGCGDDSSPADGGGRDATAMDATARDASERDGTIADATGIDSAAVLFCIFDSSLDAGGPFDAAVCSGTVTDPEDCPPGCRAVG